MPNDDAGYIETLRKVELMETKLDKVRQIIQSNYNASKIAEAIADAAHSESMKMAAKAMTIVYESLIKQLSEEGLIF